MEPWRWQANAKAGALIIVMGRALSWEKLGGVSDNVGVAKGDKSRGCRDELKGTFTSTLIFTHWSLDAPMIVETDASDYAIAGILSLCCSNDKLRLVPYYSWILSALELNYDTHDKKLLTIHEAFKSWCHYLEGSAALVNVVTDHKNLEYFVTTKLLTQWQACWSEVLPSSTWSFVSAPESLVQSLTPLLDAGTSFQKRGIRTMLASILTISIQSSHRNSSLHPSKLLISQLQSSRLVFYLT